MKNFVKSGAVKYINVEEENSQALTPRESVRESAKHTPRRRNNRKSKLGDAVYF